MNCAVQVLHRCRSLLGAVSLAARSCKISQRHSNHQMVLWAGLHSSVWAPSAVTTLRHNLPLIVPIRGMAGHSKWQNIRHIKAAKDGMKMRASEKLVHRIKLAVKEGGSADPKLNSRLAAILLEGKKSNVPNATMENALKTSEKARLASKPLVLEAIGPGNCHVLIDVASQKPQWDRSLIQHILKKYGCSLGVAGTTAHSFEQKGIIQTQLPEGEFDLDAATEAAIEAGAEDVEKTINDDAIEVLQFICGPKDLHVVRSALEEQNYQTLIARMEYIPIMTVPVPEEQFDIFTKLADALEDHETVIRIYSNIEVQDS